MGSPSQPGPTDSARPGLDDLLRTLRSGPGTAQATARRIQDLLEAVLVVGRDLDLGQALRHIVEAAVTLVDAEYGALGVIGEEQGLSRFVPVGIDQERIERIGPLPSGHGLLGELIRHPGPLRLAEISEHPASYGFPEHHPPMHSFLGVPIRVRDRVYGNLYLTGKRGGAEFDADDEAVLETLAAAAGVAVDHARLYAQARLSERWLAATAEVTNVLLSGSSQREVLDLLIARAADIAGADLTVVALPSSDGRSLEVRVAVGLDAEVHRGLVLPTEGSFVGAAVRTGGLVTTADVRKDPRITVGPPPRWAGLGPAVAVPIGTAAGGVRGVLMLARAEGKPVFGPEESTPLAGFAGQAAVAMELAERRRDSEQVALLEERDRIARDLHDLAIQRLFATGMTLQGATRFIEHPEASERVLRAIDDLDETVRTIRSSIFGLRAKDRGPVAHGLRGRVVATVDRAAAGLGFAPALRMEGLLDLRVPPPVGDALVAVLEEALSNAVRHARAHNVQVDLSADGELKLTVTDDGIGLPPGGPRSGLANLEERALRLDGSFQAGAGPDGGTRLEWRVPLPGPERGTPPG
ncbi:GAF domain-containing protein [Kitasatospora sp. NBC_00240]|uniref:GAF domain-containing sensor histidine kinase n=1 Tax=Kitasatospora sp. NBC_00240 TaxID=2903567 RepID=UPI002258E789|nr:GAF domain-containing protein [Kitasatospora sp. NBC_00240]MCX5208242.1 GAF domain-containing protein [Kitasatospora sp. NBC_00240]